MKNIVSVVVITLLTWCSTYLYHLVVGVSNIIKFIMAFLVIGLLLNGIHYAWSITSIKRSFKKEIRMDADSRIQENPDCGATQILYGKRHSL